LAGSRSPATIASAIASPVVHLVECFLHVLKVDSREFNETIAVTERIAQISSFGRNEPRSSPQA